MWTDMLSVSSSERRSSMEQAKKRQRNLNYTRKETEKLLSLIEAHINIIGNKKSDAVTWKKKEKAWKTIEEEFNRCCSGAFRDARHLKLKYEALKKDIRKKERAKVCTVESEFDDSPPLLTAAEEKTKELMLLSDEVGENADNTLYSDGSEHMENIVVDSFPEAEPNIASMQRQMIADELEEKMLKKELLKLAIKNKQELHELHKTEMLLKIEILKTELENKKKLL